MPHHDSIEETKSNHEAWAFRNIVLGNVRSARKIDVIEVVSISGLGINGSPVREVTDWYLEDGTHIGHWDHYESQTPVV